MISEKQELGFKGDKWWSAPQQLGRKLLRFVGDLRLAILLLLAIALFSISGTIIEQGQTLEFYQTNYPSDPALFGFLTWKVLLFLGLNSVYHTWWFLALLIVFGSSLTACTFTHQWPALNAARTWKYYQQPRQFEKLALSAQLNGEHLNQIATLLQKRRYRVFTDASETGGKTLYARKGIIGKIGPILVHASILVILGGSIWGGLNGFMAQELVPSGGNFTIQNIIDAGPFSQERVPKDWGVKVNRFWIEYTPEGDIDQFYSDLSVINNSGSEQKRETIHVNQPLRYQGITIYQTNWGIAAIRVRLNNSPIFQLPMATIETNGGGRIWGTWIPTKPDLSAGVSVIAKDLQGTVLIYGSDGKLITTAREGMATEVNGVNLSILDVIGSTGLQIKADPGIPFVYAGFAFLMLGVVWSYFSHSQIWALEKDGKLYVGGKTNRAQVSFERELMDILGQIPGA